MLAVPRSRRAHPLAFGRFLVLLTLTVVTLAACGDDDDDPSGPGGDVQLTSGTPVTNIAGDEESERYYKITVPEGASFLTVTTSGGSGDLDLAIRHGQRPTFDDGECFSSASETNNEECEIEDPEAGTWYIQLYGFEAYSGATLTATVSNPIER